MRQQVLNLADNEYHFFSLFATLFSVAQTSFFEFHVILIPFSLSPIPLFLSGPVALILCPSWLYRFSQEGPNQE